MYKKRMHLIPLLLTVFIDSLGFGLVFPVFSPLIVGNEVEIFSPETTLKVRGLVFGLLISTYCLGQFFSGPLLGSLSDAMGRKKVLVGSMWAGFIGYLLGALGLILHSLSLIFFARCITGIAAGSFPVAQSVIADVSNQKNKAKNFGLVGMACWTGFVVGPFFGGRLAQIGFTVPFIFAGFICLGNALLLLFRMQETHPKKGLERINWLKGVWQIRQAFTLPHLRGLFVVMFIFCLGWGFFTEFSPIFLTHRLDYDVAQIANFYAWVGLWIAISQGLLIRPLLRFVSPQKLMPIGLLSLGVILPFMLKMEGPGDLRIFVPFVALCQALIFPTSATIVSNLSGRETQGEILGINNAVQWAAISLPPLFSGGFVALYPHLSVTVSSACMIIAFLVFLKVCRFKTTENTLE